MTTAFLIQDIAQDEGFRPHAYLDSRGIWTDGYGHAHVDPNATAEISAARAQLAEDVQTALALLDHHIPWWRGLNDARQDVLANMAFNMGWLSADGRHGLGTFVRTLEMIRTGRYIQAADMMLQSAWAQEVGRRAHRLADQMRFGFRAGDAPLAVAPTPASYVPPPLSWFGKLKAMFA